MGRLAIASQPAMSVGRTATLTFQPPPPAQVWLASVNVPAADPFAQWFVLISGARVATFYGAGPFGPLEIFPQETLTLVGANLLNGIQFVANLVGSTRDATDEVGAYTLPVSPAPISEPVLQSNFGLGEYAHNDVVVSASTTLLFSSDFQNYTIKAGVTLTCRSLQIRCSDTLTVEAGGLITCSGGNGTGAAGGAGVIGTARLPGGGNGGAPAAVGAAPPATFTYSGSGGGAGSGGVAGGAGTQPPNLVNFNYLASNKPGGGGGGGGAAGAGGGGGGGVLIIIARRIIMDGRVQCNGGNGFTNGANGGGAGGAGTLIVVSRSFEGTGQFPYLAEGGIAGANGGGAEQGNVFLINSA